MSLIVRISARSFSGNEMSYAVFELFDQFHDLDRRQTDVVDEIAIDVDVRSFLGELVDKLLEASGIILAFCHGVVIDWGGC